MEDNVKREADFIFETSWEVCNKVGGIYTVISTKASSIIQKCKDKLILIGPECSRASNVNEDFIEDENLYKSWRQQAEADGLHFRIGHWDIPGKPIVILADFTSYFVEKDKIFGEFWEDFNLNSLHGGWDYIEPAMFGYAAAKIIESFYEYNMTSHDRFVAHFHEWMTGTGILYLKKNVPQAATVFTTHATALGRSIAGNGLPLYSDLDAFDANELANQFNIASKYSLEKLSAIHADGFTTVSDITALECKHLLGKKVDIVTPNGFEDSFVPEESLFKEKRELAKNKLFEVAEALMNQKLDSNTQFLINSGRYEFKNKGIDLFIDALGKLNKDENLKRTVVAFITVPANHTSVNHELVNRLDNKDFKKTVTEEYLTHYLFDEASDPVINRIKKNGLTNSKTDKVKIIFVPCYLNGNDGIFNLTYYDLLIGFDVSVFPSYYEPWGYTPLESAAFHIPTITTNLAGFGLWVKSNFGNDNDGVRVIDRTDTNDDEFVHQLALQLEKYSQIKKEEFSQLRTKAFEISRVALWENLADNYFRLYDLALSKAEQRDGIYKRKQIIVPDQIKSNRPVWNKVLVTSEFPEALNPLLEISKNLWWSWNEPAIELFRSIDQKAWNTFEENPIALLESLTAKRLKELVSDTNFMNRLNAVYRDFSEYLKKSENRASDLIAYFSMEFGMHDSIKIFSGGLGVLAGDYLKEASDSNENLIGIGLLYRHGYFNQQISMYGDQIASYKPQKFSNMPLLPVKDENNEWVTVNISLTGRDVVAKAWKIQVGRVNLYLLDTDLEENSSKDRFITHQLYGGDWNNRFKQEMLLGLGGVRLIKKLGLTPKVYHCNEGHAALIGLERLKNYMIEDRLSFDEAKEVVRSSTLFTTHTPVPAGHDSFDEDILRAYFSRFSEYLNISWEVFMGLGRANEFDVKEKFSMSILAAKLSQEINGVSKLHGKVSQAMFSKLYDGYFPEESHISYVTNGVHLPTWASSDWKAFYEKHFGKTFFDNQLDRKNWNKIYEVSNEEIWKLRQTQRKKLIEYLKLRLEKDLTKRQENPKFILNTLQSYNDKTLTIGFARRFATYKRAHLLFSNLERLAKIVSNPDYPIQFIFAGKAHPADKAGQDLIKRIVEISKLPEFLGKITFVENYDINLGKALVQGVDVWLNTPTRLMEASGTSGEKAVMNGVLNFSVLDGWWAEGYIENAGWSLEEQKTFINQNHQDQYDAEQIYDVFENQIAPLFYKRDKNNIPNDWVLFIKKNIAEISPRFTMKRQLDDYQQQFYNKLMKRSDLINADNFKIAKELSAWKRKVLNVWEEIKVKAIKMPDYSNHSIKLSEFFQAEIEIDTRGLKPTEIGVEVLFAQKENGEVKSILFKSELSLESSKGHIAQYKCNVKANVTGVFDFAFRIFPKHELLEYRQDFPIMKWI